VCCVTEDCRS
jgi:hypothetical protein